jgi:outer membrane lipoprotein
MQDTADTIKKCLPCLLSLTWLLLAACSVVSHPVKSTALSGVAFPTLVNDVGRYRGRTVVLGGYLLETQNRTSATVLTVLQAPLGLRDEPGSRDDSRGRFQVVWSGFLDPEIYKKGRRVTVAGIVMGKHMGPAGDTRIAYLQLEGIEIHLWKPYQEVYYTPAYYDPWYDPFFRYRPLFWYGPFDHYPRVHPYHPYRRRPPHHPPRRPAGPRPGAPRR